jgi:hypothetical protein
MPLLKKLNRAGRELYFMGSPKYTVLLLIATLATVNSAQALTGTIELVSPDDGVLTNKTNTDVPFTFKFTDPDNATADCTLYVNGNAYDPSSVANDTEDSILADDDFSEGANVWNITCVNGTSITSETRTLTADRVAPSIELISPDDGSVTSPGNVDFFFNFTDAYSSQAGCNLSTNATEGDSGIFQNGTESSFTLAFSEGSYEWRVACTDAAGNTGASGVRVMEVSAAFSVSIISPRNQTYDHLDDIALDFTTNEAADWTGYSLDGADNVTITGNTTFDVSSEGQHVIELYANDSLGIVDSQKVYFSVELPEENDVDFVKPSDDVINMNFLTVNVSTDDPVQGCLISMDGEDNVSMTNVSETSWYCSFTGLSEGPHDLEVWCNDSGTWITDDTDFRVVVSGFNIDIETPLSKTYWGTDSLDILVRLNMDASRCEFYLDSEGPTALHKYNSRTWYYNMSGVGAGDYTLLIRCDDTSGFSNSSSVSFTLRAGECEDNETGICTDTQQCINHECVDIECGDCEYAEDHRCKSYECCSDDDCLAVQHCVSHECLAVSCECGKIEGHKCVEYECCSNFDCDINEECDKETHTCFKRALTILAPDSIVAGEEITISLVDQDMEPVLGAKIKVEYKSGIMESLTTDEDGSVSLVARESGPIIIMADLAGYDRETITAEVTPGIDLTAVFMLLILMVAGGTGFFYWKHMPPLSLKKEVKGQAVVLRVKNRSGEYIENVLISDTVPRGAFISCGLTPRMENLGNETSLSWFATLNEGEEIVINYQAVQTSDKFLVRAGDDEYESGFGLLKIIDGIIGKLHKENAEEPPLE